MDKRELFEQISRERRATLVVNTRARQGRALYRRALILLEQSGFILTDKYPIDDPLELMKVVERLVNRGDRLVIVGGGDGTVSSVVDYFAYRDSVFGLLPLGTGNSFAQTLGIPFDLPGATRVIAEGKIAEIDLGVVGDDYFANMVTIGLSAQAAMHIPHRVKKYFGPLAYGIAGAYAFFMHKPFRCRLVSPDLTSEISTHQIIVGNGRIYGRMPVARDATVKDRRLSIFVMGGPHRAQMIRSGIEFVLGRHESSPHGRVFSAPQVTVEADPPQFIDLDGEVSGRTPATIRVAVNALKIFVPTSFPET